MNTVFLVNIQGLSDGVFPFGMHQFLANSIRITASSANSFRNPVDLQIESVNRWGDTPFQGAPVSFLQREKHGETEIIGNAICWWLNIKRFLRRLAKASRAPHNEGVTGPAKPPLFESGPPSPETLFHRCGCTTPSVANVGKNGEAWCS